MIQLITSTISNKSNPILHKNYHDIVTTLTQVQSTKYQDYTKAYALEQIMLMANYSTKEQEKIYTHIANDKDEYGIPFISISLEEYQAIKTMFNSNPILYNLGFLQECIYCSLSRNKEYNIRKQFEHILLEQVCNKFTKDTHIIITDITPGALLQLFIIVYKMHSLGYENLKIFLIDAIYDELYQHYTDIHNNYIATINHEYTWSKKEYNYLNNILKTTLNNSENNTFYLTDKFTSLINKFALHKSIFQFTQFLTTVSSGSISTVMFKSSKEYKQLAQYNNKYKTHILLAVDYLIDLYPETYHDFTSLCACCLNKNSLGINLLKNEYPHTVNYEDIHLTIAQDSNNLNHYIYDYTASKFISS